MIETWLQTARRPDIIRRGLKVGLIVGTILMLINHGDVMLTGHVSAETIIKIILTYGVPFGVSTYASVSALRERMREQELKMSSAAATTRADGRKEK